MPPKRKKARHDGHSDKLAKSQRKSNEAASANSTVNHGVSKTDWRENKTLPQSLSQMFTDQISCDVQFACGINEEKIGAHKFILICRSSVFFAMFEGPARTRDGVIKVPDISLDIIKLFLQFLYCDEVSLSGDFVMQMLYVAKKYQIYSLIRECSTFMEQNITCENACVLMEGAHTYSEPHLRNIILKFIEDNAVEVFESEGIKFLCRECIGKILDSDDLTDKSTETDLTEEHDDAGSESQSPMSYRSRSRSSSYSRSRSNSRSRSRSRSPSYDPEQCDEDEEDKDDDEDEEIPPKQKWTVHKHQCDASCSADKSCCQHDEELPFPYVSLEISVCEALLYWVNNECKKQGLELTGENRRKVGGDLRHKIHYNLVDGDYIICRLANTGLLSIEERCKVLEYHVCKDAVDAIFWKTNIRGPHRHNRWFSRFLEEENDIVVPCNGIEAISFECFEDVYIHGFSLYGACNEYDARNTDFSIVAKLYDSSAKILAQIKEDYKDDYASPSNTDYFLGDGLYGFKLRAGETKYKNILFRRKIRLQKNTLYSLVVDMSGPNTYSGTEAGMITARCKEGNTFEEDRRFGIVEFHHYDLTGYGGRTDNYAGQIPRLGLSPVERVKTL